MMQGLLQKVLGTLTNTPAQGTGLWPHLLPFMATEQIDFARIRAEAAKGGAAWGRPEAVASVVDFLEGAELHGAFALDKGLLAARSNLANLIKAGRMRTACAMAKAMHEIWGDELSEAAKALLHAPDVPAFSDLMDRPWQDIQVVDKGAPDTIVVFTSTASVFCFLLNQTHLWFSRLNANIIYVRDFHQVLYQKGFRSVGDHAASVKHLRKIASAVGGRKLVMTGHSGGVFGALTMGRDLRADAVVAFSGPSSFNLGLAAKGERPFYANIQALLDSGAMTMPDLRADYERTGIRVEYLFGALNGFDRQQARTLEGLPNVTLRPIPGVSRHSVLPEMVADGSFVKLFNDLLTA